MRTTKQISTSFDIQSGESTVIALCDDGSLWIFSTSNSGKTPWKRLPDIPQDTATIHSQEA